MKKICVIGTGGTIAGVGEAAGGNRYRAGSLDVGALLQGVPGLEAVASVRAESLVNIGSQDMTEAVWFALARRVAALLAQADCDGVVIIHGTDTLEETAFFLDRVLPVSKKTVVLTGAMRPATALSADGPRNIFAAVTTAAAPSARARGVLVVINDQIFAAASVIKTHTRGLEAFSGGDCAALGYVDGGEAVFDTAAPVAGQEAVEVRDLATVPISGLLDGQGAASPRFELEAIAAAGNLPRVGIAVAHVGESAELIGAMVRLGYRGIVYAGFGGGNFSATVLAALVAARAQGVLVVRASRVPFGPVGSGGEVDDAEHGFIAAGRLSAQKARILLSLALARGDSPEQIRTLFA